MVPLSCVVAGDEAFTPLVNVVVAERFPIATDPVLLKVTTFAIEPPPLI
jgi:hypothetical protein